MVKEGEEGFRAATRVALLAMENTQNMVTVKYHIRKKSW